MEPSISTQSFIKNEILCSFKSWKSFIRIMQFLLSTLYIFDSYNGGMSMWTLNVMETSEGANQLNYKAFDLVSSF